MATTSTMQGSTLTGYLGAKVDPNPNAVYTIQGMPTIGTGPLLRNIAPETCKMGGPQFTLYMNGARFAATSVVVFNNVDATTSFVDATILHIQVNTTATPAPVTVPVYVRNIDGKVSETCYLTITAPAD